MVCPRGEIGSGTLWKSNPPAPYTSILKSEVGEGKQGLSWRGQRGLRWEAGGWGQKRPLPATLLSFPSRCSHQQPPE